MENSKFLSGLLLLALMFPLQPEPLINDTSSVATNISSKYNLPAFLQGRVDVDTYRNWLLVKAKSLHSRDLRKNDEICSWLVNMCTSHLNPDEFVELCKTVTAFRGAR